MQKNHLNIIYMIVGFFLVLAVASFISRDNKNRFSPQIDNMPESTPDIFGVNFDKRYGLPDGVGLSALSPELADDVPSSEPLTMVTLKNGKAALADKEGKIVLKTNYDWIGKFHDGLALVKIEGDEDYGGPHPNSWGYINVKGKVVIPFQFNQAYPFSEGLAPIQDKHGRYGFTDIHGKMVIQPQYDDFMEFSDGQNQVKLNKVWIWINKKGERIQ